MDKGIFWGLELWRYFIYVRVCQCLTSLYWWYMSIHTATYAVDARLIHPWLMNGEQALAVGIRVTFGGNRLPIGWVLLTSGVQTSCQNLQQMAPKQPKQAVCPVEFPVAQPFEPGHLTCCELARCLLLLRQRWPQLGLWYFRNSGYVCVCCWRLTLCGGLSQGKPKRVAIHFGCACLVFLRFGTLLGGCLQRESSTGCHVCVGGPTVDEILH